MPCLTDGFYLFNLTPPISGLMLESEKKIFEKMDEKTKMSKHWMPLVWATNIVTAARQKGLITAEYTVNLFLIAVGDFQQKLGALLAYDSTCVPLIYTQVINSTFVQSFSINSKT